MVDNVWTATDAGGVAHRLSDFVEKLVRRQGIGIDENQNIAVRGLRANASNSCDIVDVFMHHACAEFLRNPCRAIGARVVDNDQFHAASALCAGTQDTWITFSAGTTPG
jgi:hypothetical protein